MGQAYDATGVYQYIQELDTCIDNIKNLIQEIDDEVDKTLQNKSADAGLFGIAGNRLNMVWVNNSTAYNSLVPMLEEWSGALKEIYGVNNQAANDVATTYRSGN